MSAQASARITHAGQWRKWADRYSLAAALSISTSWNVSNALPNALNSMATPPEG
jgi:hypothetical protein